MLYNSASKLRETISLVFLVQHDANVDVGDHLSAYGHFPTHYLMDNGAEFMVVLGALLHK